MFGFGGDNSYGGGGGFGGFGTAAALGGLGGAIGGRRMGASMASGALMGDMLDDGCINGSEGAFLGAAMGAMTAGIAGSGGGYSGGSTRRIQPSISPQERCRRQEAEERRQKRVEEERRKKRVQDEKERQERVAREREMARKRYEETVVKYYAIWEKAEEFFKAENYGSVLKQLHKNSEYTRIIDNYNGGTKKQEHKDLQYRRYVILFSKVMSGDYTCFSSESQSSIKNIASSEYLDDENLSNIDIIKNAFKWYTFANEFDSYWKKNLLIRRCKDSSGCFKGVSLKMLIEKIKGYKGETISDYNYLLPANLEHLEHQVSGLNQEYFVTGDDLQQFCQMYRDRMGKYGKAYRPEKLREEEICEILETTLRNDIRPENLSYHMDLIIADIAHHLTRSCLRKLKYKKGGFESAKSCIINHDFGLEGYLEKVAEMVKGHQNTDFTSTTDSTSKSSS